MLLQYFLFLFFFSFFRFSLFFLFFFFTFFFCVFFAAPLRVPPWAILPLCPPPSVRHCATLRVLHLNWSLCLSVSMSHCLYVSLSHCLFVSLSLCIIDKVIYIHQKLNADLNIGSTTSYLDIANPLPDRPRLRHIFRKFLALISSNQNVFPPEEQINLYSFAVVQWTR